MDLYERHEGKRKGRCVECRCTCFLLVMLMPTEMIRRKGYRSQARYVLQCKACCSTRILMQAESGTLYRVHA